MVALRARIKTYQQTAGEAPASTSDQTARRDRILLPEACTQLQTASPGVISCPPAEHQHITTLPSRAAATAAPVPRPFMSSMSHGKIDHHMSCSDALEALSKTLDRQDIWQPFSHASRA